MRALLDSSDMGTLVIALVGLAVVLFLAFCVLNRDEAAGQEPISDLNEWRD